MSDLQCPARVVLLAPDAVESALDGLRELRPAALCHDPHAPGAAAAASRAAARLGLAPGPLDELALTSYRTGVESVADLHRGETVVAVVGEDVVEDVHPGGRAGHADPVEVSVDADGWAIRVLSPGNPQP